MLLLKSCNARAGMDDGEIALSFQSLQLTTIFWCLHVTYRAASPPIPRNYTPRQPASSFDTTDFNMQTIVDFNAQATAPIPHHEPTTQDLASWRRAPPPDNHLGRTVDAANNVLLFVYQSPSHGVGGSSRQIPFPATSRSESAAPQSVNAARDDLNNHLRAERDRLVSDKDRLMTEKDTLINEKRRLIDDKERAVDKSEELLSSKTALWQEYYETVRSRDEQIKNLQEDYGSLARELKAQQKQNRRLANALHEYMENDGTDAGPADEAPSHHERGLESILETEHVPKVSKAERTSSWVGELAQPNVIETEARKQMAEMFRPKFPEIARDDHDTDEEPPAKRAKTCETAGTPEEHAEDEATSPQQPHPISVIDLVSSCSQTPGQAAPTQRCKALSRPANSVSDVASTPSTPESRRLTQAAEAQVRAGPVQISDSVRKLQADFLGPMNFSIRPMVQPGGVNRPDMQLASLDVRIVDSICNTLSVLRQRIQEDRVARSSPVTTKIRGCCWSWMHFSSDHLWTQVHARTFTCRTCFNSRRACLLWQGEGVWDVLPLPPQVRKQDATPADDEYYIFGREGTARSFGQVWGDSQKKSRPKRQSAGNSRGSLV